MIRITKSEFAIIHVCLFGIHTEFIFRCVLSRKGQAIDMSTDHKPEDEQEKARIIKAGGRVTGDGRVNGGLNLSRAIGDHAYKQV